MLLNILISIVMGAVAGFVAGKIMKDEGSWLRNIIVGIVGGFVAGLIPIGSGWIVGLIKGIAGACLVLFVYNKYLKKYFEK